MIIPINIGHLIGSSFGLVFVLVNSAPLASGLRIAANILAVAVFLVILAAFGHTARMIRQRGTAQGKPKDSVVGFPVRYWIIVGVEAVFLFGGLALIQQIEPAATLGWIALVVGAHFFPLSRLWASGRAQIVTIAWAMSMLGIAGLVLAFTTHNADAVTVVSGVGSGIVLLGTAFIVAIRNLIQRSGAR